MTQLDDRDGGWVCSLCGSPIAPEPCPPVEAWAAFGTHLRMYHKRYMRKVHV